MLVILERKYISPADPLTWKMYINESQAAYFHLNALLKCNISTSVIRIGFTNKNELEATKKSFLNIWHLTLSQWTLENVSKPTVLVKQTDKVSAFSNKIE